MENLDLSQSFHHSRPQDWLLPFEKQQTTNLDKEESISLLIHYELKTPIANQRFHSIFIVTKKGEKAIGKNITCLKENNLSTKNSNIVAKYPIENETDLINEITSDAIGLAISLAKADNLPLKLEMNQPLLLIKNQKNLTNNELIEELKNDNRTEPEITKMITELLGLETTQNSTTTQQTTTPPLTNLMSIEQEKELITKFGKKQIQNLAKKIHYKGNLINKDEKKITIDQLIK